MSTVELKRIVDEATPEEQEFLFICLSERLYPTTKEQLEEFDHRLTEMGAGKGRLSLEEFERRLDKPTRVK